MDEVQTGILICKQMTYYEKYCKKGMCFLNFIKIIKTKDYK